MGTAHIFQEACYVLARLISVQHSPHLPGLLEIRSTFLGVIEVCMNTPHIS